MFSHFFIFFRLSPLFHRNDRQQFILKKFKLFFYCETNNSACSYLFLVKNALVTWLKDEIVCFYINISFVSAKACFCFLSFISIFSIIVVLGPLTVFFKNLTYCAQCTCMIIVINAVTIEQLHVVTSYRGYVWACANLAIPWCWFQAF